MPEPQRFLIVEQQILVQMDLSLCLHEVSPDAEVLAVSTLVQARDALQHNRQLDGIVVGTSLQDWRASGLSQDFARSDTWVVCLTGSHADAIRAEGWHPLILPFSTDDAQRLFAELIDRQVVNSTAS